MLRQPEQINELGEFLDMLVKLSDLFKIEGEDNYTSDMHAILDTLDAVILSPDPDNYTYTSKQKTEIRKAWKKYAKTPDVC